MRIKIEIDVEPDELRRFLGLPDVVALQEDLIQFVRDKVGAAGGVFDPTTFVKGNLKTLRQSAAWQKLVAAAGKRPAANSAPPAQPKKPRKRKTSKATTPKRRTSANAKVTSPPAANEAGPATVITKDVA